MDENQWSWRILDLQMHALFEKFEIPEWVRIAEKRLSINPPASAQCCGFESGAPPNRAD